MVLIRNSQQLFFIDCYKKLIKEKICKTMLFFTLFMSSYVWKLPLCDRMLEVTGAIYRRRRFRWRMIPPQN